MLDFRTCNRCRAPHRAQIPLVHSILKNGVIFLDYSHLSHLKIILYLLTYNTCLILTEFSDCRTSFLTLLITTHLQPDNIDAANVTLNLPSDSQQQLKIPDNLTRREIRSVFCSWTVYFYGGPFWSSDLKVSFSNPYFNFWGTVAYFNGITGAYYSWYYTNFFVVLQINLTANLCKSLFFKVILSLTLRIIFYLIMIYFLQVAVSNFFLFFFLLWRWESPFAVSWIILHGVVNYFLSIMNSIFTMWWVNFWSDNTLRVWPKCWLPWRPFFKFSFRRRSSSAFQENECQLAHEQDCLQLVTKMLQTTDRVQNADYRLRI